jgi:hypothetical protein
VAEKKSLPRDNDFFPTTSAKSQQINRTKFVNIAMEHFQKENLQE